MTTVCDDEVGLQVHDKQSLSSNSTNKVIQNLDMFKQGDTDHYDRKINDGRYMKSARQFMEECDVPCYNTTIKNYGMFPEGITKNKMPLPFSLYMMNLYFDNVESEDHLRQMKKMYTCDIPGSFSYIDPPDHDNKTLFRPSDFYQARE